MATSILPLSHQQQQEAAEQIHQLIATGMSSSQAIAQVAHEIRQRHRTDPCHHTAKKNILQR
jgi:uncharacterized protein YoaH (UPF0181 family)